jgi:hypothetical protein
MFAPRCHLYSLTPPKPAPTYRAWTPIAWADELVRKSFSGTGDPTLSSVAGAVMVTLIVGVGAPLSWTAVCPKHCNASDTERNRGVAVAATRNRCADPRRPAAERDPGTSVPNPIQVLTAVGR